MFSLKCFFGFHLPRNTNPLRGVSGGTSCARCTKAITPPKPYATDVAHPAIGRLPECERCGREAVVHGVRVRLGCLPSDDMTLSVCDPCDKAMRDIMP